ncbi:Succinylglutamate desuccinylase [Candidatus Xenohaliotis californiensis]|uniref:Succinylglutamate desuccinylase n=1 Tax=Candidatus Xenohaliotis californiensis TaxID=84677 RepID=A0ABM9N8C0_9RICK|nr:Succinylglutamate desuccinylase [Candidatus Xenohaliotis californiensis]
MIITHIHTRTLASGEQLNIPTFHFKGTDKNAPSAYIQSSIHASEVQGCLVSLQLIEHFRKNPPLGNITLLPLTNPYAINHKVGDYTLGRFDPSTGENWNRLYEDLTHLVKDFLEKHSWAHFDQLIPLFKQTLKQHLKQQGNGSYAKKLARDLHMIAIMADVVLDLHCDTTSIPHVYSVNYAVKSATHLGIPFIISIPSVFAHALDEAIFCPWIALTKVYNQNHKNGIPKKIPVEVFTVELGSAEIISSQEATQQANNILHYLSTKGICTDVPCNQPNLFYTCILNDFQTLYAPIGGLITNCAPLGQIAPANKCLMHLTQPSLWCKTPKSKDIIAYSSQNISLNCNTIPITHSASAVVHEGMELMKVFTNYKTLHRNLITA